MATIKSIARELGMPTTSKGYLDGMSWVKRGGHAGSKTINSVRKRAIELGWSDKPSISERPDGGVVTHGSDLFDPTGEYRLETYCTYGAESSDNYFSIYLRRHMK